tara:strand:+ start:641 stop:1252 length:612 start_codon:yes stop_codon:yes gene_type:complete
MMWIKLLFRKRPLCTVVLFFCFLPCQVPVFANVEIANLKQDLQLFSREVAGLRSEVELMRRENAQLRMALEQITRQSNARTGDAQGMMSQVDARLRTIEKRVSANEQALGVMQSNVDSKMSDLITQMNKGFKKVSSSANSAPPQPTFTTDYPQKGFVHKVEKGETVSSIAKKYQSKISWIINANQIADATKVNVGKELFVPQK